VKKILILLPETRSHIVTLCFFIVLSVCPLKLDMVDFYCFIVIELSVLQSFVSKLQKMTMSPANWDSFSEMELSMLFCIGKSKMMHRRFPHDLLYEIKGSYIKEPFGYCKKQQWKKIENG
jgi:hypothetical protein